MSSLSVHILPCTATVAGDTALPMDPSQLAAVQQATRHLVQLPRVHSKLVIWYTVCTVSGVLIAYTALGGMECAPTPLYATFTEET